MNLQCWSTSLSVILFSTCLVLVLTGVVCTPLDSEQIIWKPTENGELHCLRQIHAGPTSRRYSGNRDCKHKHAATDASNVHITNTVFTDAYAVLIYTSTRRISEWSSSRRHHEYSRLRLSKSSHVTTRHGMRAKCKRSFVAQTEVTLTLRIHLDSWN